MYHAQTAVASGQSAADVAKTEARPPSDLPKRLSGNTSTPEGQFVLGTRYFNKQDFENAYFWYQKSATSGDPQAASALANMYHGGYGVHRDDTQAAYWWTISAKSGFRYAQYMLGNVYHDGIGVRRDDRIAAYWWHKAIESPATNDVDVYISNQALRRLAGLYRIGEGVVRDEHIAEELDRRVIPADEEVQYCCSRSATKAGNGIGVLR
jgi:TPR repeat protein